MATEDENKPSDGLKLNESAIGDALRQLGLARNCFKDASTLLSKHQYYTTLKTVTIKSLSKEFSSINSIFTQVGSEISKLNRDGQQTRAAEIANERIADGMLDRLLEKGGRITASAGMADFGFLVDDEKDEGGDRSFNGGKSPFDKIISKYGLTKNNDGIWGGYYFDTSNVKDPRNECSNTRIVVDRNGNVSYGSGSVKGKGSGIYSHVNENSDKVLIFFGGGSTGTNGYAANAPSCIVNYPQVYNNASYVVVPPKAYQTSKTNIKPGNGKPLIQASSNGVTKVSDAIEFFVEDVKQKTGNDDLKIYSVGFSWGGYAIAPVDDALTQKGIKIEAELRMEGTCAKGYSANQRAACYAEMERSRSSDITRCYLFGNDKGNELMTGSEATAIALKDEENMTFIQIGEPGKKVGHSDIAKQALPLIESLLTDN